MDQYFYITLSLYVLSIWLIILFLRRDLKKKLLITSLIGGVAGVLAELWYFKDYWRPVSFMNNSNTLLEDFLFGFAVVGVSAIVYDFIYKTKIRYGLKTRFVSMVSFFFLGLTLLIIGNNWLKINSILVSSFLFILFSSIITGLRRDLIKPAIVTAIVLVLLILPFYFIVLNFIFPQYLAEYYLFYNTRLGLTILGNIPLTELLWYFSWGLLSGVGYDFVMGAKKFK